MKITDEMVEAACEASVEGYTPWGSEYWDFSKERATYRSVMRSALEAAWLAIDIEGVREEKLETIAPPDNGTTTEILSAILQCANAWVPEARIIGNVRAGDISRALTAALAEQTQQGVEVKASDDVCRAASALLDTLWQIARTGKRTHEENWAEMDRCFPQARELDNALRSTRSALVDVPAVESEPVRWQRRPNPDVLNTGWVEVNEEDIPHYRRTGQDIRPLYAHPPRSLSNEGWMPIETAPMDGTDIIVFVPGNHGLVGEAYYSKGGWWWAGTYEGEYLEEPMHISNGCPTHWQPLPTPPLSTRKGSAGEGSATITSGGSDD